MHPDMIMNKLGWMDGILQTAYSTVFHWNTVFVFQIQISLNCFCKWSICSKWALVQAMTVCHSLNPKDRIRYGVYFMMVTLSIAACVYITMPQCVAASLTLKQLGQFNSLAPGKFEWNFMCVIFRWILVTDGWGISCEIALIWMSLDFTDDQSTLVQAPSHYLSQCWPRSMSPNGVTSPQWVNWIMLFNVNMVTTDGQVL